MENYKCRYCFKSFANGRALGGHMRSHMPSLHVDDKQDEAEKPSQLSYETTESDVSSSSSKEKRNGNDPKFAFTGSLLLEDDGGDESETESSRNVINLTRKRSKRTRKLDSFATKKKVKTSQLGYNPPESDPEPPHSSASDTTTEEDLAFCLMMLSRDKWKKNKSSSNNKKQVVEEIDTEEEEEEEEEEEDEEEESEGYNKSLSKMNRTTTTTTTKGRYKCETCGKVFKSYQALGGHRASHKKNRVSNKTEQRSETEHDNVVVVAAAEKRIHECPICFRVFASGQALGGHKRSHGIGNSSVNHHHHHHQAHHHQIESVKQRMIDLNLPAPAEEDEVSVVFQ